MGTQRTNSDRHVRLVLVMDATVHAEWSDTELVQNVAPYIERLIDEADGRERAHGAADPYTLNTGPGGPTAWTWPGFFEDLRDGVVEASMLGKPADRIHEVTTNQPNAPAGDKRGTRRTQLLSGLENLFDNGPDSDTGAVEVETLERMRRSHGQPEVPTYTREYLAEMEQREQQRQSKLEQELRDADQSE